MNKRDMKKYLLGEIARQLEPSNRLYNHPPYWVNSDRNRDAWDAACAELRREFEKRHSR